VERPRRYFEVWLFTPEGARLSCVEESREAAEAHATDVLVSRQAAGDRGVFMEIYDEYGLFVERIGP
jgi:hypothetical protein